MSLVSPCAFRKISSIFEVLSSQFSRFYLIRFPPADYSVCQTNNSEASVFHCNATGRHKDAVIEWRSDGRLLTDSAHTRITCNVTKEDSSGLYHFSSELSANLTSAPTCNITARGLSSVVSDGCAPLQGSDPRVYVTISWITCIETAKSCILRMSSLFHRRMEESQRPRKDTASLHKNNSSHIGACLMSGFVATAEKLILQQFVSLPKFWPW